MKLNYLAPWPLGKFMLRDHPGVYQPLASSISRQSILSNRLADDVPGPKEIESDNTLNGATKVDASIFSTQTVVGKESPLTIEMLREMIHREVLSGKIQERKAVLIDYAINDIGVGLYQWKLFVLCGLGWFCDNIWLMTVPVAVPRFVLEFNLPDGEEAYAYLALMVGLCAGATLWGGLSDAVGRRFVFNSVFWSIGAIYAAGSAYALMPGHSCVAATLPACNTVSVNDEVACCTRSDNKGWRRVSLVMACTTGSLFLCRLLLVHLFESPKILLSKGRQREAVQVVQAIAWYNGTTTWLGEDVLNEIGGCTEDVLDEKLSARQIVRNTLKTFRDESHRPLFSTRELGANTVLVWLIWALVGVAFPLFVAFLPEFLSTLNGGEVEVPLKVFYRSYLIANVVGASGIPIAAYLVTTFLGRKYTMAPASFVASILICLYTQMKTSEQQLAITCFITFFSLMAYAVLYLYTPECFATKCRGTGSGIASALNRIGGILAPLVAVHAGKGHAEPLMLISGAVLICAAVAMFFLPIETRGRAEADSFVVATVPDYGTKSISSEGDIREHFNTGLAKEST